MMADPPVSKDEFASALTIGELTILILGRGRDDRRFCGASFARMPCQNRSDNRQNCDARQSAQQECNSRAIREGSPEVRRDTLLQGGIPLACGEVHVLKGWVHHFAKRSMVAFCRRASKSRRSKAG